MGQARSASELPAPPRLKLRKTGIDSKHNANTAVSLDSPKNTSAKRQNGRNRHDPPNQLRQVIEAHKDMSKVKANADKHSYLGALKYLPHAVYKVLENMPAPWESSKEVEVIYHRTGAITFIDEIPKVDPAIYLAQWGQMWTQMREEKRDRASFRRLKIPAFDDEEPLISYPELAKLVPEIPDPVPLQPINSLFEAMEYSRPFRMDREPPTMFDLPSFTTAKNVDIQIPNGPAFETNPNDEKCELLKRSGPSAFDDPQRQIYRPRQNPVRVEAQVAFPRLYSHDMSSNNISAARPPDQDEAPYMFPLNALIKRHDNKKALFVDQSITRTPDQVHRNGESRLQSRPPDVKPFLCDSSVDEQLLARHLACYESTFPFTTSSLNVGGRLRRAQDVSLVKPLYVNRRPLRVMAPKTRSSYQRLLKNRVKRALLSAKIRRAQATRPSSLLKTLGSTKYFGRTRLDWLEAAIQLIKQGHQILQLLIHRRGLHFMHLDYNFNLKPTKTLTTKERKRSRFGNSFHMIRELLKFVKLIVDCFIQFRLGNVDAFELNDGIHYIFTHMGQLTGLYRYKYKVMHQITATNDLKHVIYDRFNSDGVGKGPGCGIWQPAWSVWLAFLRGNLPMLERWLGNLIQRQFFGRVSKGIAKSITKQRIDSAYDLELRAAVLHDILDVIPEQLRKSKTKIVMQHLSEAWRCWKANVVWEVSGMPAPIKQVIERYIQAKADHWTKVTQINRERIRQGKVVDKAVARKNLGRITRLWMRTEQNRQKEYVNSGPYLEAEDAVAIYKTMARFLKASAFTAPIEFPDANYPHDTKLLTLALETLKNEFNMSSRLSNTQREQLSLIENAYDNPYNTLQQIKTKLETQRVFKDVEVSLLDFHSHLAPVYHVDVEEQIVDSYLDQYLWYEAERRHLIPNWVKPTDSDVAPIMVRKFCSNLNNDAQLWSTEDDRTSSLIHFKLKSFVENVDFTLLNNLLKLIMDDRLADYISSKMNASLVFKDMAHINQYGIIRGFHFSSFVVQYYLMMVDILLLGPSRALELVRAEEDAAGFNTDHPIRAYMRYFDDIYVVFHFSRNDADDIIKDNPSNDPDTEYPVKRCWSHERMMRLIRRDVQLGKSLIDELGSRVPEELGTISCLDASVYSVDNPALHFDMAGFEVRLIPKTRLLEELGENATKDLATEEALWSLIDESSGERTGFAFLKVSEEAILKFDNRVRQILMSSGSTTFAKIAKRWNTTLTATATYFREAAVATPALLSSIVKGEVRVQNKIKMGLNSKMPARFPPCVFYSPEELGGLGMLSASHILIPETDIHGNTTRYKLGMTSDDESYVPNLFRYINSWEAEALDSHTAWQEYAQKRISANADNSRILAEDLEEIWDRGLPRISTLFQKDRAILAFDKGFRSRQEYKNFGTDHYDPFWWTSSRHDGRLWNFSNYRTDVVQSLGGIKAILDHTLFKATGFEDWEGLFWQKQSGFEQQMQMQKLTNAQRSGLSQIPNRRFTLWWSPTINRGNVYVGFMVQLDLTGIFLHGKIPTLKISYIQVFRAHLWQKIHESLVMNVSTILDNEESILGIEEVSKLTIHPRKSYRMNASTADVLIRSSNGSTGWSISKPSGLADDCNDFDFTLSTEYWIDIQLRYGDFDSHNISRYTKSKFLDYTNDGVSDYPSKTGLMICFDLAYNSYDAYGHWFPGLKQLMRQALAKILQSNPALFILRERIRKALQLHQSAPRQPHLTTDNFTEFVDDNSMLLDDTSVYRVTTHKTASGNMANKAVNGALFGFKPNSGDLMIEVIHAESTWAGQKKLGAVSKWKTAEILAEYFRSLPSSDLPSQVVIASRGLRDPLEVNMLEFSDIKVRNSDMNFPFHGLLNLHRFKSMVDDAKASFLNTEINLYDDWLTISQETTAFSRLMLILRALVVSPDRANALLSEYSHSTGFIWPKLSRSEWITVENELSDIVIEEYGDSHNIDTRALTQSEIRDIILGQRIAEVSEERQRDVLESNDQSGTVSSTAVVTKTHNVHGEQISVVATSNYEQQTFDSRNSWRNRALKVASVLPFQAKSVSVEISQNIATTRLIEIPRNLVQEFIMLCDTRNLVVGLLFGKENTVSCIAMVPQIGSGTTVTFAPLPDNDFMPDSAGLSLLGIIRSQPVPRPDAKVSPIDLTVLGSRNDIDTTNVLTILVNSISSSGTKLQAFELTQEGMAWGRDNRDLLSLTPKGYSSNFGLSCDIRLGTNVGYFYVPEDDVWNYSFMAAMWNNKFRMPMKIGLARGYFDLVHRPMHFKKAAELNTQYDADEEYELE